MSDGGETDAYVESQAAGECDSMDRSELLAKFAQESDSSFGKMTKTALGKMNKTFRNFLLITSVASNTVEDVAEKIKSQQPSPEIQFAVQTTYVEAIHPALKVAEGLPEPDPHIPEKEDSEISHKRKKSEEE